MAQDQSAQGAADLKDIGRERTNRPHMGADLTAIEIENRRVIIASDKMMADLVTQEIKGVIRMGHLNDRKRQEARLRPSRQETSARRRKLRPL